MGASWSQGEETGGTGPGLERSPAKPTLDQPNPEQPSDLPLRAEPPRQAEIISGGRVPLSVRTAVAQHGGDNGRLRQAVSGRPSLLVSPSPF